MVTHAGNPPTAGSANSPACFPSVGGPITRDVVDLRQRLQQDELVDSSLSRTAHETVGQRGEVALHHLRAARRVYHRARSVGNGFRSAWRHRSLPFAPASMISPLRGILGNQRCLEPRGAATTISFSRFDMLAVRRTR
jgi:hypothetical protein